MPIREVCSKINTTKSGKPGISPASAASRKVPHTAPWGPPTGERADQKTPARFDRDLSNPDPFPPIKSGQIDVSFP
jgi:hypothetical protein